MKLSESIIQVLDEAQSSAASHSRLFTALMSLYEKARSPQDFFDLFFLPFSNVLLVYKREPAVERTVAFTANFAVKTCPKEKEEGSDQEDKEETELEESFFSLLVDKLITLHQAKDKAVRFRVCQLLAKLMNGAVDEECIVGAERLERLQQAMLTRLYDKVPVIRVHAVSALEFLQYPDPNCPVTAALLEMLAKDSSPDVRRCILNKIVTSDRSLKAVIERTRDSKDAVRRAAFVWLSTKCSIRNITIKQRIQLLEDGMNDPSEAVQEGCIGGLLRSWSVECDGDFLTLLARLDVESSPEIVRLALFKLFDNLSIEVLVGSMMELMVASHEKPEVWGEESLQVTPKINDKTTPIKQEVQGSCKRVLCKTAMTCEEVFYWCSLCHYLHGKGPKGEEGLERLTPTLSDFCSYLQSYVEEVLMAERQGEEEQAGQWEESRIRSQFVTQQLCSMLAVLDLTDEVGRSCLSRMVCDLLTLSGFPVALICPLLELQTRIWPQDNDRIERLTEVIAELRQPSTLKSTGERAPPLAPPVNVSSLLEESYLSASQTNQSFLELQEDPDTLIRCLTITCELLKHLKMRKLDNPILLMLAETLLYPCVLNENPYVRDMAIHCVGLACLLDLSIARNHILLFLQVSQLDHESVQATALKVVFDLLHVYGFEAFNATPSTGGGVKEEVKEEEGEGVGEKAESQEENEDQQNDGITQKLLNIMAAFLEGESGLLREVAGEGICKLLLSRRILSHKLLAKLLVLWYNPTTQEERLRSTLGLFFPSFASLDRDSRLCLSEVYLPVMRTVLEAPPSSPLATISTSNVSDFILQLTQPPNPNEESVHYSLALSICNEIFSDASSSTVRVYCRTLSFCQLTPSNKSSGADLLKLWEQLSCEVADKTSLRYLKKFGGMLQKICPEYSPDLGKTTKKTTVGTARKGRRKIIQHSSSSEDESESENIEPEDVAVLPEKKLSRTPKQTPSQSQLTSNLAETVCEESDDSTVGEHSPFIKQTTRKRRYSKPLQPLQYDDDDDGDTASLAR